MRAFFLAGLWAAGAAHAFSDSSPFLLFSTAEFPSRDPPAQLQTSTRVYSDAKEILSACPTSKYLLVSQLNVHATDLDGPEGCGVHRIRAALTSDDVLGRYTVAEVIEFADEHASIKDFAKHINASCSAQNILDTSVRELTLKPLPVSKDCQARAESMDDSDYILGTMLQEELPKGDYTVLFFSPSHDHDFYEAQFEDPSQIQLTKRITDHWQPVAREAEADAAAEAAPAMKTNTPAAAQNLSLFDKYQFFTPGIYMGLIALFLLLSILYVGLSSLASLQVSYGAFDKEAGPSVHKKQN